MRYNQTSKARTQISLTPHTPLLFYRFLDLIIFSLDPQVYVGMMNFEVSEKHSPPESESYLSDGSEEGDRWGGRGSSNENDERGTYASSIYSRPDSFTSAAGRFAYKQTRDHRVRTPSPPPPVAPRKPFVAPAPPRSPPRQTFSTPSPSWSLHPSSPSSDPAWSSIYSPEADPARAIWRMIDDGYNPREPETPSRRSQNNHPSPLDPIFTPRGSPDPSPPPPPVPPHRYPITFSPRVAGKQPIQEVPITPTRCSLDYFQHEKTKFEEWTTPNPGPAPRPRLDQHFFTGYHPSYQFPLRPPPIPYREDLSHLVSPNSPWIASGDLGYASLSLSVPQSYPTAPSPQHSQPPGMFHGQDGRLYHYTPSRDTMCVNTMSGPHPSPRPEFVVPRSSLEQVSYTQQIPPVGPMVQYPPLNIAGSDGMAGLSQQVSGPTASLDDEAGLKKASKWSLGTLKSRTWTGKDGKGKNKEKENGPKHARSIQTSAPVNRRIGLMGPISESSSSTYSYSSGPPSSEIPIIQSDAGAMLAAAQSKRQTRRSSIKGTLRNFKDKVGETGEKVGDMMDKWVAKYVDLESESDEEMRMAKLVQQELALLEIKKQKEHQQVLMVKGRRGVFGISGGYPPGGKGGRGGPSRPQLPPPPPELPR